MKKNQRPLSTRFIEKMAPGQKFSDDPSKDGGERGLWVERSAAGDKIQFYWRRTVDGKVKRIGLGLYPTTTLEGARDEAHTLNKKRQYGTLTKGGTLTTDIPSLRQLWKKYRKDHLPKRSAKTGKDYTRIVEVRMAHLLDLKITDITKQVVSDLHSEIGEISHSDANKTRAVLSSMLNRARHWYDCYTALPVMPERFPEKKETRFLSEEEVPELLDVLMKHKHRDWAELFIVALLIGGRKNEICGMQWEHLILSKQLWNKPNKGGNFKPTGVPKVAVEILRSRYARQQGRFAPGDLREKFVFPSDRAKCGHVTAPDKTWREIRKAIGMTDLKIHHLRHTSGTWIAADEEGGLMAAKHQLGHSQASTTERYAHPVFSSTLVVLDKVADQMMATLEKKRAAEKRKQRQ